MCDDVVGCNVENSVVHIMDLKSGYPYFCSFDLCFCISHFLTFWMFNVKVGVFCDYLLFMPFISRK